MARPGCDLSNGDQSQSSRQRASTLQVSGVQRIHLPYFAFTLAGLLMKPQLAALLFSTFTVATRLGRKTDAVRLLGGAASRETANMPRRTRARVIRLVFMAGSMEVRAQDFGQSTVQSCAAERVTGCMGPLPLWPEGRIVVDGVSQRVHTCFSPTFTNFRVPLPLGQSWRTS
jgi:hypothetical protein